jgi:hypothetical protein
VVVAWDADQGRRAYTEGTAADLTVDPSGTATWAGNGADSGIRYGINGFFMIPGVTVNTENK